MLTVGLGAGPGGAVYWGQGRVTPNLFVPPWRNTVRPTLLSLTTQFPRWYQLARHLFLFSQPLNWLAGAIFYMSLADMDLYRTGSTRRPWQLLLSLRRLPHTSFDPL